MRAHSRGEALASMLDALVRDHEVADLLAQIVDDCAALLPAQAAAILVQNGTHGLELLTATSHRATELELYQAQQGSGPCVDTLHGDPLSAVGDDDMIERWPEVGAAIVRTGFHAVHAFPMRWRGRTFGGLNVFSERAEPLAEPSRRLGQNLADVATLALTSQGSLDDADLAELVDAALEGRVVIERAKGVLAETLRVDMATAYDHLLQRVLETGSTLTRTAREVIREAHER